MSNIRKPDRKELEAILKRPPGPVEVPGLDLDGIGEGWTEQDIWTVLTLETMGELLKCARKEKGLTGEQAGQKTGLTKGRISQMENLDTPAVQLQSLAEYVHALGYTLKIELVPDDEPGKALVVSL